MTPESIAAVEEAIRTGGLLLVLTALLLGGYRGWWVYGWQYRQLRRDYEECKSLLFSTTGVAERLLALRSRPSPGRDISVSAEDV